MNRFIQLEAASVEPPVVSVEDQEVHPFPTVSSANPVELQHLPFSPIDQVHQEPIRQERYCDPVLLLESTE